MPMKQSKAQREQRRARRQARKATGAKRLKRMRQFLTARKAEAVLRDMRMGAFGGWESPNFGRIFAGLVNGDHEDECAVTETR
jgi:hypothetical protein